MAARCGRFCAPFLIGRAMVPQSARKGLGFALLAVTIFAAQDGVSKHLAESYPPVFVVMIRYWAFAAFVVVRALNAPGGIARAAASANVWLQLARGGLLAAQVVVAITAFAKVGLAATMSLFAANPLILAALSVPVLGEAVGWRRWTAIGVGFVGVLIVVRPGGASFQPVSLLPVATAFLYALLMLSARWLDPRESVWTLLLYLTGAGALVAGLAAPFVWREIQSEHLWLFVAISLFGTVGMTMMTQAFRLAPAALIAPLDYTALVWATAFGWLIWSEVPDTATFLGAAVIIASGVVVILRERRRTD